MISNVVGRSVDIQLLVRKYIRHYVREWPTYVGHCWQQFFDDDSKLSILDLGVPYSSSYCRRLVVVLAVSLYTLRWCKGIKLAKEVAALRWTDVACVSLIVIGLLLFLYGANYYVEIVGWAGLALFIGGFVAYFVLKAYEFLTKKKSST